MAVYTIIKVTVSNAT